MASDADFAQADALASGTDHERSALDNVQQERVGVVENDTNDTRCLD